MKIFSIILVLISSFILGLDIYNGIVSDYKYEKDYASYWNLADKASTISKKAEGIDKFVTALENSNLKGKYNAIYLTTPDNSFDKNFEAIKSLQLRLHEIEKMDITSFQYQTAIQQITQQEQGEAKEMLSVFRGIWGKDNYPLIWNWIGTIQILLFIILLFIGIFIWSNDYY